MSATGDRLREFIASADRLPEVSTSASELDQKKIDPSEYLKVKPVKQALDNLVGYLRQFSTQNAEAYLDKFSPVIQVKIGKALSNVEQVISGVLTEVRKAENNEQVGRNSESKYQKDAERIQIIEGDLISIFEPLRLEMKLGTASIAELLSKLEQGQLQTEALRQELIASTESAKAAKGEVEDVERRATGTKEEFQASYAARGFIVELKNAIFWHRIEGWAWLAAFTLSCMATLRLLIWMSAANNKLGWPFYDCGPIYGIGTPALDLAAAITAGISKLLFASFAFGLCFLSGRIYQTHAHNIIVNQQRRIAGISFPELLGMINPEDKESRQELVRQAAISVFAHGSSGFLHKGANEFSALASLGVELLKKSKDTSSGV